MTPLRFALGAGAVLCDPDDGAPIAFTHPAHPEMNFLLGAPEAAWHNRPFAWGKGFLITARGAGSWDQPSSITRLPDGLELAFQPIPGVELRVRRQFGPCVVETYTLSHRFSEPLLLTGWGISTPFRDVYPSALECLRGACHAHVWTGGSLAYVWALPMRGRGPGLGLALEKGRLWSYSIETRNTFTGSNIRGHIRLQATDAARAPHAFGGQPPLVIPPGADYTLQWRLDWHPDFDTFQRRAFPDFPHCPRLAAPLGQPLVIEHPAATQWTATPVEPATVRRPAADRIEILADEPGVRHLDLDDGPRRMRIALLFHRPLPETVQRRAAAILARHRATERAPDRAGAFLPVDTRSGLRLQGGNWNDWSDARERMAMPILLQYAVRAGWLDAAEQRPILDAFDRFARTHLVDETGAVFEDSFHRTPHRLYNFPWLARFYWNQFRLWRQPADLDLSVRIVDRYYELGGLKFLAFWGEWIGALIDTLIAEQRTGEAARVTQHLVDHTAYFLKLDQDLPKHEVNYEQTVVAPLVLLLEETRRRRPETVPAEALIERMRWLMAFGGEQPHVRLRHIALRHWDGFWFGAYRQWGDIMPHYWTVQTAAALLHWPDDLPFDLDRAERRRRAAAILAANRLHFRDTGDATCAFVFPSCVDGNPGYHDDPIANDQDWALVYELHLRDQGAPDEGRAP